CHRRPPYRVSPSTGVSGCGCPPPVAVHTRWSVFSTKNRRPWGVAVHEPPPYSCTRDRASAGAASSSSTVPSARRRRTVVRPPSLGTDSPHQISSPTNAAPSKRGEAAEAHVAVSGEG